MALLLVGFGAWRTYAQVPQQFTVQGVLRNGMGTLQSQMVNVTVSFFDAATNGNRIAGPYGPTAVMVVDGLFTLTIADPAIISKLASKAQTWLQVTVGNDTFEPQIVTPDVYALMCSVADNLSGVLSIEHGGTGSSTQNFVDLTSDQTNIAGAKTFVGNLFGAARDTNGCRSCDFI